MNLDGHFNLFRKPDRNYVYHRMCHHSRILNGEIELVLFENHGEPGGMYLATPGHPTWTIEPMATVNQDGSRWYLHSCPMDLESVEEAQELFS